MADTTTDISLEILAKAVANPTRVAILEHVIKEETRAESDAKAEIKAKADAEEKSDEEIQELLQEFTLNGHFKGLSPKTLSEFCIETLDEERRKKGKSPGNSQNNLSNTSYHIDQLRTFGILELSDTKPCRGALQHYYRIKPELKEAVKETLRIWS